MRSLKLFFAFCLSVASAVAQKLPNTQNNSIASPINIKIDGNTGEWGNLQAYNHATDIFYTLANDNENLYLVVRAENQAVVNRIVNGGITLGINKSNKHGKSDITVTYPVFEKGEKPILGINKALLESKGVNTTTVSEATVSQTNNNFSNKSKLIMITGIPNVDTLLSVYNDNGIKVSARFDDHLAYSCELSIPLKKLGLAADKFTYHIVLNGESPLSGKDFKGNVAPAQNEITEAKLAAEQAEVGKRTAVTDFWGEYMLAKKP